MSNPETPGGDPSTTPPTSPPTAWADDATVVIPSTPLPPPPGSDPSPFGAPTANPLPPSPDPFAPPTSPPLDAPWSAAGGPTPPSGPPYDSPGFGAPPFGAAPPQGFGAGPSYGSVPPPGYVPSNPYSGTPYDLAPQSAYGGLPYGGSLPTQTRTGIATGSLVCGILGLTIALVPFFGYVGGLLALVAVPLGFIGLGAAKRQGGAGKGLAIGGIVTGALAILVCIAWTALFVVAGSTVEDDPTYGYNTDPVDGVCNEDRYLQDPDC